MTEEWLFSRSLGPDRQRVNAFLQQVRQRGVDRALAPDPAHPLESRRHQFHREMAFPPRVVAGVAAMLLAVVADDEVDGVQSLSQAFVDFRGDGAGFKRAHCAYIAGLIGKGSRLASAGKRQARFHGRVEGQARHCDHAGCDQTGEFRAPPGDGRRSGFDGPGDWRFFCLDHVRAFNDRYNYFTGMSTEEIEAAQTLYGGWERETRAFSANGSPPPKWSDFTDPLDAIGARFQRRPAERHDGRELSEGDRRSLRVLGLGPDIDRRALRERYADLVRLYHPDRNGGDRSHEKALQAVIEAYTQLKSRPAFA